MTLFVNWDQVAAFRLSRHHLMERAPARDLVFVAGDMTGAQAQLLSAAQIALSARTTDLHLAEVEKALKQRALVKATCMRQTLFLVPARELAVFVRGSAGRAEKEIRWALGKGVPAPTIDAAIDATLSVLDEPRTRPEIAERVCRVLGVQVQVHQGGGWGSYRRLAAVPVGDLNYPVVNLLQLVSARAVVCYGPNRGKDPTFVRADAWIPRWKDVPRPQAEQLLLRKYLKAFGPATARDFALWSGNTLTQAQEIWRREQAGLVPVRIEEQTAEILEEDLDALIQSRFERPIIRLLPYFDTFLLGHRERDHLVSLQDRPRVYRPQGWIAPVVLVNGRLVGVWEYAVERERLRVQVTKFGSLPRGTMAGIREEALHLGRFLGSARVELVSK